MLSINGNTFAEVFGNLATDARLDDVERAAAARIAEWEHEEEGFKSRCARAAEAGDKSAWDEADAAQSAHSESCPYEARATRASEQRVLVCDRVRFTIRPYTAGQSMNVGVEKFATAALAASEIED
jgi:hypothetical protein